MIIPPNGVFSRKEVSKFRGGGWGGGGNRDSRRVSPKTVRRTRPARIRAPACRMFAKYRQNGRCRTSLKRYCAVTTLEVRASEWSSYRLDRSGPVNFQVELGSRYWDAVRLNRRRVTARPRRSVCRSGSGGSASWTLRANSRRNLIWRVICMYIHLELGEIRPVDSQ